MRPKLEQIMELPPQTHPYFLLPPKQLEIGSQGDLPKKTFTFRELGQGQPILLMPGLWNTGYTFRLLLEPLAEKHRVLVFELLDPDGHYPETTEDLKPENLASLFFQIVEALGLAKSVIVGQAESGLGAILLGLNHQDRIKGVVTLSTAFDLPVRERLKGFVWGFGFSNVRLAKQCFAKPIQTAWQMLDYTDPTLYSRQEIRQLAQAWTTWPGAKKRAEILMQSLRKDFRAGFQASLEQLIAEGRSFPVPLKLLYGERNGTKKGTQGEKLNRFCLGSELLIEPNSGYHVQVENADWTLQQIQSLL